ncbi:MAG: PDZ domain-containing protein [Chloroflexi bacterium]|nr:PDZ domain-containing protein [Chloroflexota bacterium]
MNEPASSAPTASRRLPPALIVVGLLALAASAFALGLAVGRSGDDSGTDEAAVAPIIDREQAHETLDRFLDQLERWQADGLPAMPGFGSMPGMPGAPGDPNRFEFLQGFGQMMPGGALLGVTVDASMAGTEVVEGSPAAEAGVQVGDVIVAVAGTSVADIAEVRAAVAAIEPGATYDLTVERDGVEQRLQVVRPDDAVPSLDLESLMPWLEELHREYQERGRMAPAIPGGANTY